MLQSFGSLSPKKKGREGEKAEEIKTIKEQMKQMNFFHTKK